MFFTLSVFAFHNLAWRLEERGLGVRIWGKWMSSCLLVADILLLASLVRELQAMLKFNPKKCRVLVAGQKKQDKRWSLGGDRIQEVNECKYLTLFKSGFFWSPVARVGGTMCPLLKTMFLLY